MNLDDADLAYASATELTKALGNGELPSTELLELYLDRVHRLDGPINSVVTLDEEGAHKAAKAADDVRERGEALGPLHGLPVTVKDCFDVAGMRTTVGDPVFADYVPSIDAPLVARLRAAGAVIFGRTNVAYRLSDLQSCNPLFGCTSNPWDLSVTSGGSGGGAGAALAAGLTALDVSGDFGGSTRIPASHCGLYGLKPTFGVIPCTGMLPLPPGHRAEIDLETPGPIARSVDDVELALDVMAGPDHHLATGWRLEFPRSRATALSDFRIAVWLDDPAYPTERAVLNVLQSAVDRLADAGAKLDDVSKPSSLDEVMETFRVLAFATMGAAMDAEQYAGVVGDRLLAASHRDWFYANEKRAQLRFQWSQFFEKFDVLLAPCCVLPAHSYSDEADITRRTIDINGVTSPYLNLMAWAAPANALYLPGLAVPAGLAEGGLPVGLQLIAGYLEDRTALEAGRRIGEVIGGFCRPPGY